MVMNLAFSCGLSPGFSQFFPSGPMMAQLLCFPDPLTPANGFS